MALDDFNPLASRKKVRLEELSGKNVQFDASKDEDHEGENEVTDFPVEEGANVSDHSRPKPRTISIHAFVTGTPVSVENIASPPSTKATRGRDAWTQLDLWRRQGTRLTAITSLFKYVSVVITKVSVPRNAQNSDGIEFTVNLKEIFTVSSKLVPKPTRTTKPEGSNIGPKPTKKADPPTEVKTGGFWKEISNAVGRKLGVSQ